MINCKHRVLGTKMQECPRLYITYIYCVKIKISDKILTLLIKLISLVIGEVNVFSSAYIFAFQKVFSSFNSIDPLVDQCIIYR